MVKKKRYYYAVLNKSAEACSTGRVLLTREQAEAVKYASNPRNWIDADVEKYDGSTIINMESEIPEEWWEYHKKNRKEFM